MKLFSWMPEGLFLHRYVVFACSITRQFLLDKISVRSLTDLTILHESEQACMGDVARVFLLSHWIGLNFLTSDITYYFVAFKCYFIRHSLPVIVSYLSTVQDSEGTWAHTTL